MHLGITPHERNKKRKSLLRKGRLIATMFTIIALLPLVVYGLYHFQLLASQGAFSSNLEEPVALIQTESGKLGTAFLVSSTKMLTARHVMDTSSIGKTVTVTFEQVDPPIETTATVEWYDASQGVASSGTVSNDYFESDVAVLRLNNPSDVIDILPLDLGDSEVVQNLDEVTVVGYPLGSYSISKGNINSTDYDDKELFKLDASSNPGNSGGPVINEHDEVIGILVGHQSLALQGENVSLKINKAIELLDANSVDYSD
ncbi:MAG: serine protease [Bacteroidota bacterium]